MSSTIALTHAARITTGLAALLFSASSAAMAQDVPARSWEARVSSGALVGTGAMRRELNDAKLLSVQVARVLRPQLALTGSFSWARSRDVASAGTPRLDVFGSDIGIELRSAERFADRRVSLSSFAGFGGGARSYNHRGLDVAATHNLAGYASVGGEVGMGRVALRLEARDYVTGFRPLVGGGASVSRNDVVVMGALRFNRQRRASHDR